MNDTTVTPKLYNPGLFRASNGRVYLVELKDGKPTEPPFLVDSGYLLNTFSVQNQDDRAVFKTQDKLFGWISSALCDYTSTPNDFEANKHIQSFKAEIANYEDLIKLVDDCICRDPVIIQEYKTAYSSHKKQP